MRDFWHDLEVSTNDQQRRLLRLINCHLDDLSRCIEAAVSERLEIRLEPVAIHLAVPNAQEFHTSIQDLFAKGKPLALLGNDN